MQLVVKFVHHNLARMNQGDGLLGIEFLYISGHLNADCSSAYDDNLRTSYHFLSMFLQIGYCLEFFGSR